MGSQILRPTKIKGEKGEWVIQGPWGQRTFSTMNKVDLWERLHRELIDSGELPRDSPSPSNRRHSHVTMTVMNCSWIDRRWVRDEPFRAQTEKTSR